jgi:hypothetical protein
MQDSIAVHCLGHRFADRRAMRPEEIQELMQTMNQPKIAHTLPQENENDEDVDTET